MVSTVADARTVTAMSAAYTTASSVASRRCPSSSATIGLSPSRPRARCRRRTAQQPHEKERQRHDRHELARGEPCIASRRGEHDEASERDHGGCPRDERQKCCAGQPVEETPQHGERGDRQRGDEKQDLSKARVLIVLEIGADDQQAAEQPKDGPS